MTSPTPSFPRSNRHRVCRYARSPVVLITIALGYVVSLLVFRDADHALSSVALRGSSEAIDAPEAGARNVAAAWDPEAPSPRISYGGSARGPVKGGVEIYPVQPTRRLRRATPPLTPEVAEIEGTLTAWVMPDVYASGGGEALKGLYVIFHGCHHGPLDWFDLPEERAIVDLLVSRGYAVVAPASRDRQSGCWKQHTAEGDINPVKAVLWRWYRDWSIPPNTPLFLFGVSSGGNMATAMASMGGFQLCEKRTTYVQVSGAMSQVSWGVPPPSYGPGCPPLAFMPMPKGEPAESGDGTENVPQVFGNSRKIPQQITSIAHYVRKSGGRPRMLLLPIGELSLYKEFFSDRVYEISVDQSARLHGSLLATRAVVCDPARSTDGETECFLTRNPRETPQVLETLVTAYEATLPKPLEEALPANNTAVVPHLATDGNPEDNAAALPMLEPSSEPNGGGVRRALWASNITPRGVLTKAHATEVFRELLNVAWGEHEISADFVSLWEKWLWDSCGENCRPGPWR